MHAFAQGAGVTGPFRTVDRRSLQMSERALRSRRVLGGFNGRRDRQPIPRWLADGRQPDPRPDADERHQHRGPRDQGLEEDGRHRPSATGLRVSETPSCRIRRCRATIRLTLEDRRSSSGVGGVPIGGPPAPVCSDAHLSSRGLSRPSGHASYIAIARAMATAAASAPAKTRVTMSTRRRDLHRGINGRPNPWLGRRVKLGPERCGRAMCGMWKCGVLMASVLDEARGAT